MPRGYVFKTVKDKVTNEVICMRIKGMRSRGYLGEQG